MRGANGVKCRGSVIIEDWVAAAAGAVGYALEQAAKQVAKHARISRRIADIIASTDQEKDRAAALRMDAWCSSMLSHSRTVSPPPMKMSRPAP